MSEKVDQGTGQAVETLRQPMIECENLVKIYKTAEIEVVALQGLDLTVEAGELMAIIGNSGSGKSTLLNALGGLDRPSAGKLLVDGRDLLKFTDAQQVAYKREVVGFVWQNNARNLIPYLTALENVELPMVLTGESRRRHRALKLLDTVGMAHRRNSRLNQLSGGEQQRVAIAISLANNPRLLLADEPTGSVDSKTAAHILDVFRELSRHMGLTIVIVTHDLQLSKKVDRVVAIRDGRTSSEYIRRQSVREEMETLRGLGEDGEQETHEELVVVDRTGRLQIPAAYLESLGLKGKNKIKVELEDHRIVLYAPGDTRAGQQAETSAETQDGKSHAKQDDLSAAMREEAPAATQAEAPIATPAEAPIATPTEAPNTAWRETLPETADGRDAEEAK